MNTDKAIRRSTVAAVVIVAAVAAWLRPGELRHEIFVRAISPTCSGSHQSRRSRVGVVHR